MGGEGTLGTDGMKVDNCLDRVLSNPSTTVSYLLENQVDMLSVEAYDA